MKFVWSKRLAKLKWGLLDSERVMSQQLRQILVTEDLWNAAEDLDWMLTGEL